MSYYTRHAAEVERRHAAVAQQVAVEAEGDASCNVTWRSTIQYNYNTRSYNITQYKRLNIYIYIYVHTYA